MKKISVTLGFILLAFCMFAQNYTPLDNGPAVKFSIKNFGLTVTGSFTGLKGKIVFNPANLSASSISTTIDAVTVNTGNGSRDGHLKKEEYFNVAKYPLISFVSTKISNSTKTGTLFMEGNITIKGVTKAVSFPFTATAKNDGYLFAGQFKLNRRDFGVGGSSMVMSDNLTVSLAVEAKKN